MIKEGKVTLHEYSDLDSMIASIWKNSGLSENEKHIIQSRFGIHMRKHTLVELAATHDITRERVRRMEKAAINRIKISLNQDKLSDFLQGKRDDIWDALSQHQETIRKSVDLDNLEDNLTFETHLAIELYVDRRHRSIKQAALGDWLDEHFDHDESNWYRSRAQAPDSKPAESNINAGLSSFLDTI